jgi:hypothetical protein
MATKNIMLNIPGAVPQFFQIVVWNDFNFGFAPNTINPNIPIWNQFFSSYMGTSGLFTFTPGTSVFYPVIYGGNSTWSAEPLYVSTIPEPAALGLLVVGLSVYLAKPRKQARKI